MMESKNNSLSFEKIKDQTNSYLLLKKWLNQPEVLEWYEGTRFDLKMTIKKFQPKILNKTNSHPFFVILNQQKIGYIQFYELNEYQEIFHELLVKPNQMVVGIDLFIGDKVNQDHGWGTKIIQNFCQFLQKNYQVTKIIADPQVRNSRATKVYEKCGFKKQKILQKHEFFQNQKLDCWLMVKN